MKIIDLLKKNAIELNTSVASKNDAIDKLIALHEKAGNLLDVNEYKKAILAREAQGSTAIGEGIAVPHAKSESVKTPGLSAITVQNGVDYGAPDGKNSDILFMIAAPLDGDLHLEILSRLMVMLMEPEFCAALRSAKTADEFLSVIDKKETEKIQVMYVNENHLGELKISYELNLDVTERNGETTTLSGKYTLIYIFFL